MLLQSGEGVQLLFDWSTRASKQIRTQGSDLIELQAALAKQTADPSWIPGKVKTVPWEGVQVYHLRPHSPRTIVGKAS